MSKKSFESDLERRIFELIMTFPERIDAMETRSEETARLLAQRIARLVREEANAGNNP